MIALEVDPAIAATLALSALIFKLYEDPLRIFIRNAAARIETDITPKSQTERAD